MRHTDSRDRSGSDPRPTGMPIEHVNSPGYTLISEREIPEYESVGRLFSHDRTGCQVYHLENDDEENLFAFVFKTPPTNNRGTAHIIEHAVLSGSKRFPIKDPFIALSRGSMNTFLNAMTYPDKTIYPASSMVRRDFFNLLSVYGDAVFFPLLRKETFHQEGRRYLLDDEGRIDVDGVVFNEMKGNYSTHDSIVGEWSYRSLFPDSPYRFDSGGEPDSIRDLTYEEFLDFHAKFYHPANCRVFLYGDIPAGEILSFLDDRFFSEFSASSIPVPQIHTQPRQRVPTSLSLTSPAIEEDDANTGTTITVNWLTASVHDPLLVLSLEILTEILLGHSGSPLHRAVVESGIGEDLSPVSGLDTQTLELVFSVGVRGTSPERAGEFEQLVISTLRGIVENGFPKDVVTGAVNRVEFRNREIKGGAPFGLRLLGRAIRGWLHDDPPEHTLEFARWMAKVSEHASRPGYFESLVRELLLENGHRSTVIVRPDGTHETKELERYRRWQQTRTESSSEPELEAIVADLTRFDEFQETPDSKEALETVPSLHIDDVPPIVETIATSGFERAEAPLRLLEHYTHGIVYVELAFDLAGTESQLLDVFPLLCRAVCNAGLPGTSYDEVARRLSIHTGGFTSFLESNSVPNPGTGAFDLQRSVACFRIKALAHELPQALELTFDLIRNADLGDHERMRDLLLELRNDFRSQLLPSGHSFALIRAASALSPVFAAEERWKGITQYFRLQELAAPDRIQEVCDSLASARRATLHRNALTASITAEAGFMSEAVRLVSEAIERLNEGTATDPLTNVPASLPETPRYESLMAPTSIGYVAQVFPGAVYGSPEHAAEVVLSQLLRSGYLWEQVRMRGGAYGVFAGAHGGEGLFSFSSYRDPNIRETFDAFADGLDLLAGDLLPDSEIEKAIITIAGREARPMSPSEKSLVSFRRHLYGITDDMRQAKRDDLLALDPARIKVAAARLREELSRSSSVVLAGESAIDSVADMLPELALNRTIIPMR